MIGTYGRSDADGAWLQLAIGAALRAHGESLVETQRHADERMRANHCRQNEAAAIAG